MLTAEDLAKIQKKRKRSGASSTKPVAVVEPTERHFAVVGQTSAVATSKANGVRSSDDPLRSTPSSQPNQSVEYDPVNFVHFYPYEDFSNFDMRQYFIDSCRFMGIDLFDPNLKTMTADELWSHRCTIRPRPPPQPTASAVSESISVMAPSHPSTISSTAINDVNNNNQNSLDTQTPTSSSLSSATAAWGRSLLLRRLLPYDDPRRQYTSQFIHFFNNYRFKRLFSKSVTDDVFWSNHFMGQGDNPYGPNSVKLFGMASVVRYYSALLKCAPDIIHHLIRSEIYITPQGKMLIAISRMTYSTQTFQGVMDKLADMTLTTPAPTRPASSNNSVSDSPLPDLPSKKDNHDRTCKNHGDDEDDDELDQRSAISSLSGSENSNCMFVDAETDLSLEKGILNPPIYIPETVELSPDGLYVTGTLRDLDTQTNDNLRKHDPQGFYAAFDKSALVNTINSVGPHCAKTNLSTTDSLSSTVLTSAKQIDLEQRELKRASAALDTISLGTGKTICATDTTFCLIAPGMTQAERVWVMHFGIC